MINTTINPNGPIPNNCPDPALTAKISLGIVTVTLTLAGVSRISKNRMEPAKQTQNYPWRRSHRVYPRPLLLLNNKKESLAGIRRRLLINF